jgi:hypothetical protein
MKTFRQFLYEQESDDEDINAMRYGPKVSVNGGPSKRSNERTPEENNQVDQLRNQARKQQGMSSTSSKPSGSTKKLQPVDSFNNSSGIDNF